MIRWLLSLFRPKRLTDLTLEQRMMTVNMANTTLKRKPRR